MQAAEGLETGRFLGLEVKPHEAKAEKLRQQIAEEKRKAPFEGFEGGKKSKKKKKGGYRGGAASSALVTSYEKLCDAFLDILGQC